MDLGGPQLLTNILTPEELTETPPLVQEKLKNYLDWFFDEYCKEKAAANRLHDYEKRTEELESQIQDYEVKLQNYNQNVLELRSQLDTVSADRTRLLEEVNTYEKQNSALRLEKNSISDERDSLVKALERQNTEISMLQDEKRSCEQQLKNAINAKCEAIARVDEIESKEVSLGFKERRMEKEHDMLHGQIQTLTEDLNRTVNELQNLRREHNVNHMVINARLTEKVEELKITQTQCMQYRETIDRLTVKVQELTSNINSQNEEANKMMDFYKKELEAKAKLAELYKNNCDDTIMESGELKMAIADLKRMLSEASDEYGQLETKFKATMLKHEEELEEKLKIIESQKAELKNANDLLKEVQHESVDNAISKLAPSAAVASRLIRADMSLTELYSLYVKTTEDLELQKRENSRMNLQLKTILQELTENAPMIKKQEIEYEKLIETNNILAHQRDELLKVKTDMEESVMNTMSKMNHVERENKKLKHSQTDLSRQVCYLLKEVEQLRMGIIPDSGPSYSGNMSTTNEVISKKLVTFSNIPELQENNQKLLLLVRDLSTKLEEAETLKQDIDKAGYQEKLETYMKKFQNMQDTLNQQNNTVATLVSKCERYKKMYFDIQKQLNKSEIGEMMDDESMDMIDENAEQPSAAPTNSNVQQKRHVDENAEKRIRDLQNQLQEMKDQYKTLREQYEYYAQEKKNNDKIQNEQFDSMRTEVRELTSTNCKLMSSLEYAKEQLKLQQKNIGTYKQQITALEERNKNYEITNIKHEQTVQLLKDEIINAQRGHAAAESEANHLRNENRLIKDTVTRLQSEKEIMHREQQNQNLLLNNLEFIKSNLERSETEGRVRLEQRLDETVRELSAQRRRFQEEEDRFRETVSDLKRQTELAKQRMEEERSQANKLRDELTSLREELSTKTLQVDELSKKLQESLTPSKNDNPIALANKKAREFEVRFEEAKIEIAALTSQLEKVREHADQYYKMSQSAETEIKNLHDVHTAYVAKAETEIKNLKNIEENLKSKVSELEAEIQLGSMTENAAPNQSEQLKKLQDELKEALQKLSECNRNLRTLRAENNTLAESLNGVETKYANEMVLHSADIQELTKLKSELIKIQDQIDALKTDRDTAQAAYTELKSSQEESFRLLQHEKNELEQRITDLTGYNSNLHDQIEALTTKLAVLSQSSTMNTANTSMQNDSMMDTSGAGDLNRSSQIEDEMKSSDKLLQVIKFLRKEKDLMVAKVDILKAESTRLNSENTILQKKVDELNAFLNVERTRSESSIVSATKHEEILRKIETLDAITDSNRILREERNALTARVKELNERISAIEKELFPLQTQNRELATKIDELSSENSTLRTEAIRWRQRANVLVEKSNKNPEEFKRLQMERENLAKMLTNEKETLRQAMEQINALKTEKERHEVKITAHERQLHSVSEEKRKIEEDFVAQKQNIARLMQEVMELKNKLLQKEEVIQKFTDDLEAKEAQLQDSKNKEIQIRKIAKRYKDSYLEQLNKPNANDGNAGGASDGMELNANAGNTAEGGAPAVNAAELEQHRATIESLNGIIRNHEEENEKLRKELEELKLIAENEEHTKALLREAKSRIAALTEAKNTVMQELANTKTKLQGVLQSADSQDATINAVKTQYEESKETVMRLTRENEALLMRINHLGRQLGLQQTAKPSTSSVAIADKNCISESSPRTANVKPMSGSAGVQQSATVTPRRGGETPLASIRPISVQNSRTAAILPTSQQAPTGGSSNSTSSSSSTSTSTSSATAVAASGSSVNTSSSSAGCSNTALVPPQQQVHTTGSSSLESMSSSPTSSHTDYMPSTSSVAVAAIPPMGSTSSASAAAAESSQEAESVQQPQPNESQLLVSGGQPQVVALVSPRVEGSAQNAPSPNMPHAQQDGSQQQQPSTSGTTSSSSHNAVSGHNRHTPSSSNVTTTQSGSSAGHKRPRDLGGDSANSAEESGSEKGPKHAKRLRTPMHGAEAATMVIGDSDLDVEYQVPTSSQRDQEDDIVVVDSEEDEEEEDGMGEADDGPADGDGDAENEGYEDSYEQDQDMDEGECPEINEANVRGAHVTDADNNEVDVDESLDQAQVQCSSDTGNSDNVVEIAAYSGASTSHQAAVVAAVAAVALAHSHQQDSQQQSQAISSGSGNCDPNINNIPQTGPIAMQMQWKQTPSGSATSTLTRQQKATLMMLQQNTSNVHVVEGNESGQETNATRRSDSTAEIVSSPQGSKFAASYSELQELQEQADNNSVEAQPGEERVGDAAEQFAPEDYSQKKADDVASEEVAVKKVVSGNVPVGNSNTATNIVVVVDEGEEVDEDFSEEVPVSIEVPGNVDSESHQSGNATQSEMQDIQQNQVEDNEGVDGVSSEGEKQAVEEIEEEGREAEATTSPTITTRSKATKGAAASRRPNRGFQRGGRPTPIIWQDSQPGNSRNTSPNQRGNLDPSISPQRGFPSQRSQRARRMRRAAGGGNYGNMRYS